MTMEAKILQEINRILEKYGIEETGHPIYIREAEKELYYYGEKRFGMKEEFEPLHSMVKETLFKLFGKEPEIDKAFKDSFGVSVIVREVMGEKYPEIAVKSFASTIYMVHPSATAKRSRTFRDLED